MPDSLPNPPDMATLSARADALTQRMRNLRRWLIQERLRFRSLGDSARNAGIGCPADDQTCQEQA